MQTGREIIGHYKSKVFSSIFRFSSSPHFKFTVGVMLDLKPDSTFKYETCGNIITGNWTREKNNLILKTKLNYLKKDSSILKSTTIVYEIRDDVELHRMFGEKRNRVDFLVKK